MKQEINHFSFALTADNNAQALKSTSSNLLSSKRKWIIPFLFLALCYIAFRLCYSSSRSETDNLQLVIVEVVVVVMLFLILFAISIRIRKQSTTAQKEVTQLRKQLQKKDESLESLVMFSELQKSKLKSTAMLKEKLISILSHDMRVPFNSFKKLISDYEKGFISSRVFIIGILETKNELLKVDDTIINLLNLPEKGKPAASREFISPQKVNEIVDSAIFLYNKYTKNKKIDIIPYIQLPENMCLCIPVRELGIILRSLISNAIKFSKYESIIIITLKADTSGSVATLSVKDFGKGMQSSALNLMNRPWALSGIGALDESSLGVGLRIVFDVIENNNLQYSIESEVEKGTTFLVNIPLVTC